MTDFMSALAAGLESAKNTDRQRREIDEKLNSLQALVLQGTFGAAELQFEPYANHNMAILGHSVFSLYAVSTHDTTKGRRIAYFIIDRDHGYPFVLEAPDSKWVCISVDEIEYAFSELVQATAVANFLFELIELKNR